MNKRRDEIASSWEHRQKKFGNTPRAVLFKNLPRFINNSIHNKHKEFILDNLPKQVNTILDVGCGYGRIANLISDEHPDVNISGVEISQSFANEFSKKHGKCFVGSVQQYTPEKEFDAIIIITVLMYAKQDEINTIISKLWNALKLNGKLICIEPATNFLITARKMSGNNKYEPTTRDVLYFNETEFMNIFKHEIHSNSPIITNSFGLLPLLNIPTLHHGIAITKTSLIRNY